MNIKNMLPLMAFQFTDDCNVLGSGFIEILNEAWNIIQIVIPILLVVLIMLDMVKAVTAGDDKDIKKAQSNSIKRVIIAVVIFFLPLLINVILKMAGLMSGTCGIG